MSTMSRYNELREWLGEFADELNDDQFAALINQWDEIERRWPDADDADMREAALSAAHQFITGETDAVQVGNELREVRTVERRANAAAQQVAVMMVKSGAGKAEAARLCGISRPTLDKALGE